MPQRGECKQLAGTSGEQRSAENTFGRRSWVPGPGERPDPPVPPAEPAPRPPPLPGLGSSRTNPDKAAAEGASGAAPGPVLQPLAGAGEAGGELAMEGAHGAVPVSRPATEGKGLSLSAHEARTARPLCRGAGREAGRARLNPGRVTPLREVAKWGFAATERVPLPEQSTEPLARPQCDIPAAQR